MVTIALLLALMSLFSATVATSDTVVVDRPEAYKVVEWAIGYTKRCKNYTGKITKTGPPISKFAKRIMLAPIHLFVGTACAEATPQELMADARIPKPVIQEVTNNFDSIKLNEIVATKDTEALTSLPGIGEKRANVIIAALRPITKVMRIARKALARERADAFTLRTFPAEELVRTKSAELEDLRKFRAKKVKPEETKAAVEKIQEVYV